VLAASVGRKILDPAIAIQVFCFRRAFLSRMDERIPWLIWAFALLRVSNESMWEQY
jgi:hypothetical protein